VDTRADLLAHELQHHGAAGLGVDLFWGRSHSGPVFDIIVGLWIVLGRFLIFFCGFFLWIVLGEIFSGFDFFCGFSLCFVFADKI
jgi:hypothetical protein